MKNLMRSICHWKITIKHFSPLGIGFSSQKSEFIVAVICFLSLANLSFADCLPQYEGKIKRAYFNGKYKKVDEVLRIVEDIRLSKNINQEQLKSLQKFQR